MSDIIIPPEILVQSSGLAWKQVMSGFGWSISSECHCGGVHRIEFVNGNIPGAYIKIYPKRQTFRANKSGRKVASGSVDQLQNVLNELAATTI